MKEHRTFEVIMADTDRAATDLITALETIEEILMVKADDIRPSEAARIVRLTDLVHKHNIEYF